MAQPETTLSLNRKATVGLTAVKVLIVISILVFIGILLSGFSSLVLGDDPRPQSLFLYVLPHLVALWHLGLPVGNPKKTMPLGLGLTATVAVVCVIGHVVSVMPWLPHTEHIGVIAPFHWTAWTLVVSSQTALACSAVLTVFLSKGIGRLRFFAGIVEAGGILIIAVFLIFAPAMMRGQADVGRPCHLALSSAISSVRNLVTSQITYQATIGDGDFATSLEELVRVRLIGQWLVEGGCYTYTLTGDKSTFVVSARPLVYGLIAEHSYFSDETGVIRYTTEDRPATVEDKLLGQ